MGLFDILFPPRKQKQTEKVMSKGQTIKVLNGYSPSFTTWNGEIFENELVRACIDAAGRHISKLKVDIYGSGNEKLKARLKYYPNSFQTWSQFLYRTSTILMLCNTCFIVPVYDNDLNVIGIYPVIPTRCKVVQYKDELWLKYEFNRHETAAVEMRKTAILTRHQFRHDFFGDPNNGLDNTLKLMDLDTQAINAAIRNSATYKFIAQVSNFTFDDDLARERKRFSEENLSKDAKDTGGLLLFPNTYNNIREVNHHPYTVDPEEQKRIKENVFDYFGLNEEVLQNRANSEMLDAFFNGHIEPFAIQFSEAVTRMLFTERQIVAGNKLIANANRLQYMSVTQKVQMAKELGDRGALYIDEIRELFNYAPLPNGDGQHAPLRGEYKFVDDEGSNAESGNGKETTIDGNESTEESNENLSM